MHLVIEQGGVELYYNNSKHFEVTSFGAETVYLSGGGNIPIFKTPLMATEVKV